jgi:YfiR/HmsC-like
MVICILGLPYSTPGSNPEQITAEYQVKASYLCNFTKFVEWPTEAFPAQDSALTIGIVGEDPFGQALDGEALNMTANGHKMVVKRFRWDQDFRQSQVIFIGLTEKKHLGPILSSVKGAGVLTVSDIENFSSSGGMIGFVFDVDRIRFEINLDPALDSHISISSKLLSLASAVKGKRTR